MIRTRDFAIFLLAVLLLLAGIASTVARDSTSAAVDMVDGAQLQGAATLIDEYTVEESFEADEALSAAERLADMRERVAIYRANNRIDTDQFVVREGEPEPIVSAVEAGTTTGPTAGVVQYCNSEQQFAGYWPAGVSIEEVEGARLVIDHDRIEADSDADMIESGMIDGEVLLQLPLSQQPAGVPSCLQHDAVGVARDGSLIRNSDYEAYGFFGSDTIVGYALDGFPIYGRDDTATTDACGGADTAAGYGYVLQSDRASVLNCFSGRPASL